MPFKFGDVVLVPFPFTDQTGLKRRPAVVVSNAAYNDVRADIVVMAITSQMRPNLALGEVRVDQWHAAKLLKPSVIKLAFATLERKLVIRTLGALHADDLAMLRRAIREALC